MMIRQSICLILLCIAYTSLANKATAQLKGEVELREDFTKYIFGYGIGFDKTPFVNSFAIELGLSFHDSTKSGFALSGEIGLHHNSEVAPASYLFSPEFRDSTFIAREFSGRNDFFIVGNVGYFFENGVGLFLSGGIREGKRFMLESSEKYPGHYWEVSSHNAFLPVFGADLRYRFSNGFAPRIGYQYNRGFVAAITGTVFEPRQQPSPFEQVGDNRRFPYLGISSSYNGSSNTWGFSIEQGFVNRDTLDASGWGQGIEVGGLIHDRTIPLHTPRPLFYISGNQTRTEYLPQLETFIAFNAGYYFSSGIGIFPSVGLSFGEYQTLVSYENSPSIHYAESSRSVLHFLYGLQLRYMTGDVQFQAGYLTQRGALVAISYRHFLIDWLIGDRSERN